MRSVLRAFREEVSGALRDPGALLVLVGAITLYAFFYPTPYRREVRLEQAEFESGMRLLRVIVREGQRITQIDLDRDTARAWGAAMTAWADRPEADDT